MGKFLVAIAVMVMSGLSAASAQSYPSRPITMIVALPAGGGVDALARVIAEHMRGTLGQPIIVENMGGAGGTLSIARVVRAAPDGYTIGMGTLGQYVVSGAVYPLNFDMLADLTPVALLPDADLNVPHVDAAVLVIRAGATPLPIVQRAIDVIGRERIIGVALNRVDARTLHHDHYDYQEGYAAQEERP